MPGFISLEDAKAHVVVEDNSKDALIRRLINASSAHIESLAGFVATKRTESFLFDRFGRSLELRLRPVDADTVTVSYLDPNGDAQSFTNIRVIEKNGTTRVLPATGFCWPSAACAQGAITVSATVGFAEEAADFAEGAPENLRHATRLLVGSWLCDREGGAIPDAINRLIANERARRV